MKKLFIVIKREYFSLILEGSKKREYRDLTPYWASRLEGKRYDTVLFQVGYNKGAPRLEIEYKGFEKTSCYEILLGEIISKTNIPANFLAENKTHDKPQETSIHDCTTLPAWQQAEIDRQMNEAGY